MSDGTDRTGAPADEIERLLAERDEIAALLEGTGQRLSGWNTVDNFSTSHEDGTGQWVDWHKPQVDVLRELASLRARVAEQDARIAELEAEARVAKANEETMHGRMVAALRSRQRERDEHEATLATERARREALEHECFL